MCKEVLLRIVKNKVFKSVNIVDFSSYLHCITSWMAANPFWTGMRSKMLKMTHSLPQCTYPLDFLSVSLFPLRRILFAVLKSDLKESDISRGYRKWRWTVLRNGSSEGNLCVVSPGLTSSVLFTFISVMNCIFRVVSHSSFILHKCFSQTWGCMGNGMPFLLLNQLQPNPPLWPPLLSNQSSKILSFKAESL